MSHDALLSLRQAIRAKTAITFSNSDGSCPTLSTATHIISFQGQSFPKSTPTRLRKPGVAGSSPQDFYPLEAVYLAWSLQNVSGAEYMKHVRENGVTFGFISVTERKGVVDWLEGRAASHERIVPEASGSASAAALGAAAPTSRHAQESTTPPGSPPKSAYARTNSLSQQRSSNDVVSASSPVKRKYVPDAADLEAVKKIRQEEIELRDRNTVLRGTKLNNFSSVRQSFLDKVKKSKEQTKSGASHTSTPSTDPKMLVRKAKQSHPIIMISSSPTALVTMYNVRRFLQESTFEPSQEARARATTEGNPRPEDMIPIYRKRTVIESSGKEIEQHAKYYVVDSTEALGKFGADAWDRVVCVMTTGQAWQFKPYKWTEPRELFHHVKGVYVTWNNEPRNTKIQDWNVSELRIDQHRRHVDKSIVAQLWKELDDWILQHKPWLLSHPIAR